VGKHSGEKMLDALQECCIRIAGGDDIEQSKRNAIYMMDLNEAEKELLDEYLPFFYSITKNVK
jgi:hypothetical protein